MKKFLTFIVPYYFAFYVLKGIQSMMDWNFIPLQSFIVLFTVLALVYSYRLRPCRLTSMDTGVILLLVYQLVSYTFYDYPFAVKFGSFKGQILPYLIYFVGRNMMFADNKFLENMKTPLMFAFVCGLAFYILQPSWYVERRLASIDVNASDNAVYERMRLSSFWSWSYTVGFASLFVLMYFAKDFFGAKVSKYNVACLVVSLLALFFAQQRATIAYFFVFISMLTFFNPYKNRRKLFFFWASVLVGVAVIFFYLFKFADSRLLEYILNRSVNSDENIVSKRIAMFAGYWKVSLFGEGTGKYSHSAIYAGLDGIPDCDYIRLMREIGVVGCTLLAVVYLRACIRAFRLRRYFFFELNVLLLYIVAAIGGAPFENDSMLNFVLWYSVGRVNNPQLLKALKWRSAMAVHALKKNHVIANRIAY